MGVCGDTFGEICVIGINSPLITLCAQLYGCHLQRLLNSRQEKAGLSHERVSVQAYPILTVVLNYSGCEVNDTRGWFLSSDSLGIDQVLSHACHQSRPIGNYGQRHMVGRTVFDGIPLPTGSILLLLDPSRSFDTLGTGVAALSPWLCWSPFFSNGL